MGSLGVLSVPDFEGDSIPHDTGRSDGTGVVHRSFVQNKKKKKKKKKKTKYAREL